MLAANRWAPCAFAPNRAFRREKKIQFMKHHPGLGAAFAALGILVLPLWTAPGADTARATQFAFKYAANRPLTYAMGMKMKLNMDMKSGTESMTMKMSFDLRYRMKLTPAAESQGGVTALRLEPSGLEGDWDITGPGGHIVISLRGTEMKGTQDGNVIINTAEGVGVEQAQAFRKEITALYLSGNVDLDALGNVKGFRGDVPFVDYWTDAMSSQVGMWGIVFPGRAIAVGDTWEEALVLKKMGQIVLDGDGVRCTVTFNRKPDLVSQRGRLAEFSLSAPFSHKNLTGSIDQMGQITHVNLASFERHATGTLHFDRERGVVTDSALKTDATGSVTFEGQGQAASMELGIEMDVRVNLLPQES